MQEELKLLIAKKDELEQRIIGIDTQLKAINQAKNYENGVVDSEGFPRADVDFGQLAQYRNLKRQKAQLNNDHVKLMKQIQSKLFALHETFPDVPQQNDELIQSSKPKDKPINIEVKKQEQKKLEKKQYVIDYLTPFAKISIVENQSPAQKGGLAVGDLLSEFSEVNIYTIDNLKQIPKYVKEGLQIPIVVLRKVSKEFEGENIFELKDGNKYKKISCKVIPMKWVGKGLLGCKLDPL